MRTEKIDAQILVCATEIIAEPGDELVVIDGIVIAARVKTPRATPVKSAPPVPKRSYQQRLEVPTDAEILTAALNRPMSSAQIADLLGISKDDPRRHQTTNKVRRLYERKLLFEVPTERQRKFLYQTVKTDQAVKTDQTAKSSMPNGMDKTAMGAAP
jgi:hypothetical protein